MANLSLDQTITATFSHIKDQMPAWDAGPEAISAFLQVFFGDDPVSRVIPLIVNKLYALQGNCSFLAISSKTKTFVYAPKDQTVFDGEGLTGHRPDETKFFSTIGSRPAVTLRSPTSFTAPVGWASTKYDKSEFAPITRKWLSNAQYSSLYL